MRNHTEVVAFTCGLLPDPTPLVDIAYTMFFNLTLFHISTDYGRSTTYPHNAVLLESLYRESNIPLPGHHFQNQFINYYEGSNTEVLPAERFFPRHPIYCPSRVFIFSNVWRLQLGEMKMHHDITDSIIFISGFEGPKQQNSILHICCRISENQPLARLIMHNVKFNDKTEPCAMKISEKNFQIDMFWIFMPSRVMVKLMEPISQATRVDFVEIRYASLYGVKSFNLKNKAAFLLHLSLEWVKMDEHLCTSLLKQIPSLINLKSLAVRTYSTHCHIPRDLCPEILRSISHLNHLVHLDLNGNILADCLSNLLSESDSDLSSLEELNLGYTEITSNDINHIINIIESRKLPNLEKLDLTDNNLHKMKDEIDRLVDTAITYHQRELEVKIVRDKFPPHFVEKWETRCSGTAIKFIFRCEYEHLGMPC